MVFKGLNRFDGGFVKLFTSIYEVKLEQDYDIKNNKRSDEVAELVLWGKDQILEKMDDLGTDITPYSKSSFSELII